MTSTQARTGVSNTVYWRETEEVEPGPPLRGDHKADVCIVGGGYTGLWTAYYLKKAEPTLDIHVLEADYAGSGASGHGDGFVTPTIGHSLSSVAHAYGTERAKVAYSVVGRSIVELGRFCRQNGIDAQYEPTGYLNVATNDAQRRWLDKDLELIAKLGANQVPELLDGPRLRELVDSPALLAGFKVGGALVNPHRMSRGLSRVVRGMGVTISERTPVTEVVRTAAGHVARTAGGTVTADKLLYATNAYQHQFAPFKSMVKPYWSYAAVTEPLTDEQLAQVRWPGREGFVEARNIILFARLTQQNRILIGGGPAVNRFGNDMSDRNMRNPASMALLRRSFDRYFPAWKDVRFTHAYGGCLDMTPDLVPHVGPVGDGSFYAHGYCGNGVALTNTIGKVMRDLILEKKTAYSELLFVGAQQKTYRPEPFAFVGGKVSSAYMSLQDRFPALRRKV